MRWEPRITVTDVTVAPDPLREGQLAIGVNYVIRATNFATNLVYPFYLHREE